MSTEHKVLYETVWLDGDPAKGERFLFSCSCGHVGEEREDRKQRDREASEHVEAWG